MRYLHLTSLYLFIPCADGHNGLPVGVLQGVSKPEACVVYISVPISVVISEERYKTMVSVDVAFWILEYSFSPSH